jgi:hypothetical protein
MHTALVAPLDGFLCSSYRFVAEVVASPTGGINVQVA